MHRLKKVVHITTVHKAFDQRIFHRECVSLADAGFDVTLLSFGESSNTYNGVKVISLGKDADRKAGLNLMSRRQRTQKALKRAIKMNADILHFHDPELIGVGIELKKKTNACVIYDCHEDNVSYMKQKKYIPMAFRMILAAVIKFQEYRAIRNLDAIVTADEGMQKYFQKEGAKCVVKVENFPRIDLFLRVKNNCLQKYDLVYHGTIPKYHLETCFKVDTELVRRGVELSWLFVGKYADLEWAKKEVKKIRAEKRFVFQSAVPHETIADWVRLGRIGIIPLPDYPKFRRNVPTKLFEFMALKMPVILSDLPPSRKYVGDGKCAIMVDPDSTNEYADAILKLIQDAELRGEMGREGHRRVIENYNWDVTFKDLEELYRKLLC